MCAGITTFNALRHSGALPSDLVAIQGIGGLGHLGVQLAKKFGYQVAAISRGPQNAELAKKLGADVYIDSAATDPAAELQKLGWRARDSCHLSQWKINVRARRRAGTNGTLMVVGASMEPIEVPSIQLISGKKSFRAGRLESPPTPKTRCASPK